MLLHVAYQILTYVRVGLCRSGLLTDAKHVAVLLDVKFIFCDMSEGMVRWQSNLTRRNPSNQIAMLALFLSLLS